MRYIYVSIQTILCLAVILCSVGALKAQSSPGSLPEWEAQFNAGDSTGLQEFYEQAMRKQRSDAFAEWLELGLEAAEKYESNYYAGLFEIKQVAILRDKGEFDQALQILESRLALLGDQHPILQLKIRNGIANIYKKNQNVEEALKRRQQLVDTYKDIEFDPALKAKLYGALSQDLRELSRNPEAYDAAMEALHFAEQSQKPNILLPCLISASFIAVDNQAYQTGYDLFARIESLINPLETPEAYRYLVAKGNAYYGLDSLDRAEEMWQKALDMTEGGFSKNDFLVKTNLIGLQYLRGDKMEAIRDFNILLQGMDTLGTWSDHDILQTVHTFLSQSPAVRAHLSQDSLLQKAQAYRSSYPLQDAKVKVPAAEIAHFLLMEQITQEAQLIAKFENENSALRHQRQIMGAILTLIFLGMVASFWIVYVTRRAKAQEQHVYEARQEINRMVVVDLMKAHEIDQQDALNTQYSTLTEEVGHEIHDGMGAILSIAQYALSEWEEAQSDEDSQGHAEAQKVRAALEHAQAEARLLSHQLKKGSETSGSTLYQRIEDFAAYLNQVQESLRFEVDIEVLESVKLGRKESMQLYRVVQELVQNTLKHADATRIDMFAQPDGDHLLVIVEDDGKGFDLKQIDKSRQGIGIKGMRERMARIGGTLKFDTQPDAGTTAIISLPISLAKTEA